MIKDEPELAPDLDWMLTGTQASPGLILDTLVREYFRDVVHLAYAILGEWNIAEEAAEKTLLAIVSETHRPQTGLPIKLFIYQEALRVCHKTYAGIKLRRSIKKVLRVSDSIREPQTDARQTGIESDLWRVVDRLSYHQRTVLVLQVVSGLSIHEIAQILNTKESTLDGGTISVQRKLSEIGKPNVLPYAETESTLVESLRKIWSPVDEGELNLEMAAADLKLQYERQNHQRKTRVYIEQGVLALTGLTIIALIGWLTNRAIPKENNIPPAARTVIVTQIIRELVYITPTPAVIETPITLSAESRPELIREFILESHTRWQTLWAETIVYQHGPPGYVGPPAVRREQIWASQPQDHLLLSGPADGSVDLTVLFAGGQLQVWDDKRSQHPYDFLYSEQPETSFNTYAIFAPDEWLMPENVLKVVDQIYMIGRNAVLVDVFTPGGAPVARVWVDSLTGIPLGLRRIANDGITVQVEIYLTRLFLDVELPDPIFDPKLRLSYFVNDYQTLTPAKIPEHAIIYMRLPDYEQLPYIAPPSQYDPSGSYLILQWRQSLKMQSKNMEIVPVEVFSGGYYLGEISVGNPWNAICERSPDGRYLAIVEQTDQPPFPFSKIRWLELKGDMEDHEPLPNGSRYGTDFAFSPDNRYLAFWGCAVRADGCGVHILDLQTQETRMILAGRYAGYFTWRPDGGELAMVRSDESFLVVKPEDGEIIYQGPADWTNLVIPPDAPVNLWNVSFPPTQNGLQGCALPGKN